MPIPTIQASILDVDVCQGEKCPGCGDSQRECVVVAVSSLVALGSPYILVNLEGGDPEGWTQIAISEWTVGNADGVLCLGSFLGVISITEAEAIRSDNRGTTRVQVSNSNFAANPPTFIDGADQTLIVIAGQNGYIYASYDGLRTIETINAGVATTENLTEIRIAEEDLQVAYAIGANNAMVRSLNGLQTWEAITGPSAGDGLLSVWVPSASRLLVINDDGELWETEDGGLTWTQQTALTSMPATLTKARFSACGCDVIYLSVTDGTDSVIYRNVEGGASGYWEVLTSAPSQPVNAIGCCDSNRAIAVGGDGTDDGMVALIN